MCRFLYEHKFSVFWDGARECRCFRTFRVQLWCGLRGQTGPRTAARSAFPARAPCPVILLLRLSLTFVLQFLLAILIGIECNLIVVLMFIF